MKEMANIGLAEVQGVYTGPEADLWKLIMGEQIHIGGLTSSQDLATKAGIQAGQQGVDLCCCNGAGMRFLVRFCQVAGMIGVDVTERMVRYGEQLTQEEGMVETIDFVLRDVTDTGLDAAAVDFVWGEDAWCYVVDKDKLISEAARLVKSGGTIAFTDWVEGPAGLSDAEAERFLSFMKFPNVQSMAGYCQLLEKHGCAVKHAEDTGRFAPHVDLYLNMLGMQLTYDALKIIGFNAQLMEAMAGEMTFMQELAHAGKIAQGLFVATNT